ncbi:class IIb bacteriocin, lactobin A/cerein 7B family [Paraliobacillus sp. JSM ZJ581]|uniref:class IIb bacteriocin, lactobin A/cerein 7B family n=1 Tax=Paraliobacillus sp. JSM ZJ581 TaxID=3342118 RepID=UPI0035A94BD0
MQESLREDFGVMSGTNFKSLNEGELLEIDGGFITVGAIIAGILFIGGVAIGVAWAFAD